MRSGEMKKSDESKITRNQLGGDIHNTVNNRNFKNNKINKR